MGIGNEIFVFLGLSYHGGKDRNGRPGSREKEIGFEIPQAKTLRLFQIGELYLSTGGAHGSPSGTRISMVRCTFWMEHDASGTRIPMLWSDFWVILGLI